MPIQANAQQPTGEPRSGVLIPRNAYPFSLMMQSILKNAIGPLSYSPVIIRMEASVGTGSPFPPPTAERFDVRLSRGHVSGVQATQPRPSICSPNSRPLQRLNSIVDRLVAVWTADTGNKIRVRHGGVVSARPSYVGGRRCARAATGDAFMKPSATDGAASDRVSDR